MILKQLLWSDDTIENPQQNLTRSLDSLNMYALRKKYIIAKEINIPRVVWLGIINEIKLAVYHAKMSEYFLWGFLDGNKEVLKKTSNENIGHLQKLKPESAS